MGASGLCCPAADQEGTRSLSRKGCCCWSPLKPRLGLTGRPDRGARAPGPVRHESWGIQRPDAVAVPLRRALGHGSLPELPGWSWHWQANAECAFLTRKPRPCPALVALVSHRVPHRVPEGCGTVSPRAWPPFPHSLPTRTASRLYESSCRTCSTPTPTSTWPGAGRRCPRSWPGATQGLGEGSAGTHGPPGSCRSTTCTSK